MNLSQTDRQTTDNRQTDIFELTPIHMGIFFFFFCIWEGENEWGENKVDNFVQLYKHFMNINFPINNYQ